MFNSAFLYNISWKYDLKCLKMEIEWLFELENNIQTVVLYTESDPVSQTIIVSASIGH